MSLQPWFATGMLLLGAALMVVAVIGVLRMPDLFMRMQAASKASALGMGLVLLSVAVHFGDLGVSGRAAAGVVFLFVTIPVAAHLIARAAYRTGTPLHPTTSPDELREVLHPDEPTTPRESPSPPSSR